MKRFPDGVESKSFFEKHIPSHAPDWVHSVDVPANDGQDVIPYAMVNDLPTLAWAANLGTIELHVPLWHVGRHRKLPARPDYMVFDLDPGEGTSIVECCRGGRLRHGRAGRAGNGSRSPRPADQRACSCTPRSGRRRPGTACETAAMRSPASWNPITGTSWSPTCAGRCAGAASSSTGVRTIRRRRRSPSTRCGRCPTPTVSTPVTPAEVRRCAAKNDPTLLRFETDDVLRRVDKDGDLFAPLGLD